MRAIEIEKSGGPEVMKIGRRPTPKPQRGEVLIQVAAAGINRPDVGQRRGLYPPPPGASDVLGLEVSGTVAALGEDVTAWKIGDAVCALVSGGGYAEYCTAPQGQCLPKPSNLSFIEAASLPETFFTVWANLFGPSGLRPGDSVLVQGGSSGIGVTAIQLARAFNHQVFATAGNSEKCIACEKLGARAIDYKSEDFVAVIKKETAERGVDVILDMVGGDYAERNYHAAAIDGRVVQIALLGGPKATVNFAKLMMKRLHHTGSTLRPRTNADKAAMVAAIEAKVMPLLRDGRVKPLMDSTFPLERAADAHRRMETSEHIGKIVLAV
jgi:NADPH:quinone reductase